MKKKVLVTGASRGIGASISKKLAIEGYDVYGTSTSGKGSTFGVNKWVIGDFSSDEGIKDFLLLLNQLPVFDILINNAGINIIKPQENISSNDYEMIQNINLKAPYQIAQYLAKSMALKGGGKIIHIASIWSVISKSNRSLYSTMKTGLIGLTRASAVEWASRNVLINAISPGFVETDLTKASLTKNQQSLMKDQIPLKRFALPHEIAELVYFLSSDKNTYITGQNIIIDGGFTIV